jgi:hypothetical protein
MRRLLDILVTHDVCKDGKSDERKDVTEKKNPPSPC